MLFRSPGGPWNTTRYGRHHPIMEIFDILDDDGAVTGTARRDECHSGTFLLHAVVHVLVFDPAGRLFLQKRSMLKDIEPGKWDTSVGGHIISGETPDEALRRETAEELGIVPSGFERLYSHIIQSGIEREYVHSYRCIWDGRIRFDEKEIDDVRLFTESEISEHGGEGFFTSRFETEGKLYQSNFKDNPRILIRCLMDRE